MQSVAIVPTAQARRYLGQFCKHFAHRLPVEQAEDNATGVVDFGKGKCHLHADGNQLELSVDCLNAEDVPVVQDVVARHLVRFAFREEIIMNWGPAV